MQVFFIYYFLSNRTKQTCAFYHASCVPSNGDIVVSTQLHQLKTQQLSPSRFLGYDIKVPNKHLSFTPVTNYYHLQPGLCPGYCW